MNRKSISASFNSDEIESIDRVCAKLDITRGRLIKEAVTFWMGNKPYEAFVKKYPNAAELLYEYRKIIEKTGKQDEKKIMSRFLRLNKSFLVNAVYEAQRAFPELEEHHEAYHALAKKKKSGRPRNPKRKRGDRKQRGEGEI